MHRSSISLLLVLLSLQIVATALAQSSYTFSDFTTSTWTAEISTRVVFSGKLTPVPNEACPSGAVCVGCEFRIRLEAKQLGSEDWEDLVFQPSISVDACPGTESRYPIPHGEFHEDGTFLIYWTPDHSGKIMVRPKLETIQGDSWVALAVGPPLGWITIEPSLFLGFIPAESVERQNQYLLGLALLLFLISVTVVYVSYRALRGKRGDRLASGPRPATSLPQNGRMFCRKCGRQIPRDSLFCQECGAQLTQ